jgi:DNA polymerase elongation subunit (family B)
MSDFKQYTYVDQIGSKILHRWVDSKGEHHAELANFCPTLYCLSNNEQAEYRGIGKERLEPVHFNTIWDAREFVQKYEDVEGFPIFGNQNWWAQFIQEEYTGQIDWSMDHLTIANLDIEVLMDKGFPDPNKAVSEITCITVGIFNGKTHTWSTKPYDGCEEDDGSVPFDFEECKNEKEMLFKFLVFWKHLEPHVVTGWNIDGFDIPYMVNRIRRVLGEEYINHLAPTAKRFTKKCVNEREFQGNVEYSFNGMVILDYMRLYKKFTFKERERYSLDFICYVELGERKLDYSEYGNLDELWEKNPSKYIYYNVRDVHLVERLDKKKNLMALIFTLSYMCHIRFDDPLSQVRMWDTFIYNQLLDDKVVIPPKKAHSKNQKYEGAVVFDPQIGMHDWVVSFDLNSLYPHLIMQYNISPEKLVDRYEVDEELDFNVLDLVAGTPNIDFLKDRGLTMTANRQFFEVDSRGFLPAMMDHLYAQRKTVKEAQLAAEQEVEDIKAILHERGEAA